MRYLIEEHRTGKETILKTVQEEEMFDILQEEGLKDNTERKKIAVYKLPVNCLIDWS